jgi:hypothetical protein
MTQAVNRRLLTAEARVRTLVRPRGICDRQRGIGSGFYPSPLVSRCQYYFTMAVHTHISSVGRTIVRWRMQFRDIVSPHRHEQP